MNDVVLINSPIILYENEQEKSFYAWHGGDNKSYYPLNILYLASYLLSKGHTVRVIDIAGEDLFLSQVIAEVNKEKPLLVGISSMTTGTQSAVTLGRILKEQGFKVGLGGVHLTCDPDFINRFPYFDFGVIGEGEITLEKIVSNLKRGEPIEKLYKGETCDNLDLLPFPARHLINKNIYLREEQDKKDVNAAGMLSSRGCPFNCSFCCIPARGKKVRFRSAKNVVDEMEEVYEDCKGNYSFVDDCFTIDIKRISEICEEIIRRKITCRWIASTRADRLTPALGRLLAHAGCNELYFGVESGNERIRNKVIGKNLTEKSIKEAVEICRKNKIMSNLFLMIGFPTETRKEMLDTVNIGSRVKADAIGIHVTCPMPGSKLFQEAIDLKIIPPDIVDRFASGSLGKAWRGNYPLFVPPESSWEEIVEMKKLAYRRFFINPAWMWRRFIIWLKIRGRFREDLKLFKIAWHVFTTGGSKGQLS